MPRATEQRETPFPIEAKPSVQREREKRSGAQDRLTLTTRNFADRVAMPERGSGEVRSRRKVRRKLRTRFDRRLNELNARRIGVRIATPRQVDVRRLPFVSALVAGHAQRRQNVDVPAERLVWVRYTHPRVMKPPHVLRQRRNIREFGCRGAVRMQNRKRALNQKNQRQPSENR